jgi:hypothetical protein
MRGAPSAFGIAGIPGGRAGLDVPALHAFLAPRPGGTSGVWFRDASGNLDEVLYAGVFLPDSAGESDHPLDPFAGATGRPTPVVRNHLV